MCRSTYSLFVAHVSTDLPWVEGYLIPALDLPPDRVLTPRRFEPGMPVVTSRASHWLQPLHHSDPYTRLSRR